MTGRSFYKSTIDRLRRWKLQHHDWSTFTKDRIDSAPRGHLQSTIYFWDLRRIRVALGELDWQLPPIPAATYDATKPLSVQLPTPVD